MSISGGDHEPAPSTSWVTASGGSQVGLGGFSKIGVVQAPVRACAVSAARTGVSTRVYWLLAHFD
jgi:hypothetical protein